MAFVAVLLPKVGGGCCRLAGRGRAGVAGADGLRAGCAGAGGLAGRGRRSGGLPCWPSSLLPSLLLCWACVAAVLRLRLVFVSVLLAWAAAVGEAVAVFRAAAGRADLRGELTLVILHKNGHDFSTHRIRVLVPN